jgi:hypothetical protein
MALNPFARKSAISKWAAGSSPEDDLHVEPGRPKFAQHADTKARRAVEDAWDIPKDKKTEALAKYKPGSKVRGNAMAVRMKGKSGKVKSVSQTGAGAFRYVITLDGGGTDTALESELQRG